MNCRHCGKPIAPGAQFCSGCGVPFAAAAGYGGGPGAKKGMPAVAIIAIVVAVSFFAVAFIGILIAISVPGFIKARQEARKRACQENLQRIDGAKQQFALDANKSGDYEPAWGEIINPAKRGYLNQQPVCPAGGVYSINTVDEEPECSMVREWHALS